MHHHAVCYDHFPISCENTINTSPYLPISDTAAFSYKHRGINKQYFACGCLIMFQHTDLACHYRGEEEASTQAEGVDLTGDSFDSFSIICRPPQVQYSPVT